MSINIEAFYQKYTAHYEWLYVCGDKFSDYDELVEAFDSFLPNHTEFVTEFCEYTGDFISSDREAAAFMLTMMDFS